MMMTPLFAAALFCLGTGIAARGAGRAFPVDSENYAIDQFQKLNPYINYDETNYLVDVSGPYANCEYLGVSDFVQVERKAKDGSLIGGYVDQTYGSRSDSDAVKEYIRTVINRWVSKPNSGIYKQILAANRFGCSVRPGCSGQAVVSCLFSPAYSGTNPNEETGEQDALAFTLQQYEVAEIITGRSWDRNHFLENLSGYETDCAMVRLNEWSFPYAHQEAGKRGMRIVGQYGSSPNLGATEPAMVKVLEQMKPVNAKSVGCSIIPDCQQPGQQMNVVVACVFQVA